MNPAGIDLDHDRIPDVLSQTLTNLIGRIEMLENQLHAVRRLADGSRMHTRRAVTEICEATQASIEPKTPALS